MLILMGEWLFFTAYVMMNLCFTITYVHSHGTSDVSSNRRTQREWDFSEG